MEVDWEPRRTATERMLSETGRSDRAEIGRKDLKVPERIEV